MRKRIFTLFLALTMVFGAGIYADNAIAADMPLSGGGTEGSPYLIPDLAALEAFRDSVNNGESYEGKFVKLTADIDLSAKYGEGKANWTPIGWFEIDLNDYELSQEAPFAGTFDGNGHKIKGLYYYNDIDDVGLENVGFFGYATGTVKNLAVTGSVINRYYSGAGVGGIAGSCNGTIANCYFAGNIESPAHVGGIVGGCPGDVINCYNTATLTGEHCIGGIVGTTGGWSEREIRNCYNAGRIIKIKVDDEYDDIYFGSITGGGTNAIDCYYLEDTYGQGVPLESTDDIDRTTMLTAEQMKNQANFANWDFDTVWEMNADLGRPILRAVPEAEAVKPHEHSLVHHVAVAPTCTTAGNSEYWECTGCNKLFSDEGVTAIEKIPTLAATEHQWGAWSIETNPTLQTTGTAKRVCTNNQEHKENATVPALSDTTVWTKGALVNDLREYTSIYGTVTIKEEAVKPHEHTLVHHAAVEPTNTTSGNSEYWQCSGCQKLFSDEGITEIESIPILPPTQNGEPIESAFTDTAFLTAVRELIGKTNGEHIYKSDVENITELKVTGKDIESFQGIEYFTGLKEFYCYNNKIKDLDLSHNTKLEVLDCSYNMKLVTLNISQCPELRVLEFNYSRLTKVDLKNNPKLTRLVCYGTFLSTLNLANNKLLEELDAYNMYLTDLDLSNNPELKYIDCSWNGLQDLDVSANTKLETLYVANNKLTSLDLTNNPQISKMDCYENFMSDEPQNSIKGLESLLPQLGEPLSKEEDWNYPFRYYPQQTDDEEHNWSDWHIAVKPTLQTTGIAERDCEDPDTGSYNHTEFVTLPVLSDTTVWTKGAVVGGLQEYTSIYGTVAIKVESTTPSGSGGSGGKKPTVTEPPVTDKDPTVEPDNKMPYTDVKKNDWFYDGVLTVHKAGLMKGSSESEFEPNADITRGMFVTVLYRMEGEPEMNQNSAFADVKIDDYFAKAVAWANANGIVKGLDNSHFAPNDKVTREQMAAILYRYAEHKGYDVSGAADLSGFADSSKISPYAVDNLKWAKAAGLVNGRTETSLAPRGYTTRAEAAAMIQRFLSFAMVS